MATVGTKAEPKTEATPSSGHRQGVQARRDAALATPTDLTPAATRDGASASLIEGWIDETERRTGFLFEAARRAETAGH